MLKLEAWTRGDATRWSSGSITSRCSESGPTLQEEQYLGKWKKYFVLKMDKGFIKHASHPDSYPVASYVYLG